MVKRSTISTDGLNAFLRLQLRPINPVVYRGSFVQKDMEPLS